MNNKIVTRFYETRPFRPWAKGIVAPNHKYQIPINNLKFGILLSGEEF